MVDMGEARRKHEAAAAAKTKAVRMRMARRTNSCDRLFSWDERPQGLRPDVPDVHGLRPAEPPSAAQMFGEGRLPV